VEWYIDRGKPKNSEKNLSQCHFFHHKFHMDWPGREPGPPRWEAGEPAKFKKIYYSLTELYVKYVCLKLFWLRVAWSSKNILREHRYRSLGTSGLLKYWYCHTPAVLCNTRSVCSDTVIRECVSTVTQPLSGTWNLRFLQRWRCRWCFALLCLVDSFWKNYCLHIHENSSLKVEISTYESIFGHNHYHQ
jgi:hypothetical protein